MDFAFFGSSRLSVIVLDELSRAGLAPKVIVTTPDKPAGRKLLMTPNVVKAWATEHNIPFYDPAKLDQAFADILKKAGCDVFVVASYGKIIPGFVIDIPPKKTLNIHPSLLPKYRGPAPLPTTMLDDAKQTGVSIMRIDEQVDHGPLLSQKEVTITEWPTYEDFEELMAREGARLLADVMPKWVNGELKEAPQDHAAATFTKKIAKEDAALDLAGDPYQNFLKIQAYHEWPQAYFFAEKGGKSGSADKKKLRVKITSASFKGGALTIERVIPESGKEMAYDDFLKGYRT